VAVAASVEAEGELVEIGMEMIATQPMVDAQGPAFEIGEHAVGPRQDDVGSHGADHMGIVVDFGSAGIGGPYVGLEGRPASDVGGDEGADAFGGIVGDGSEAKASRAVADDFDGGDQRHLARLASSASAGDGVILGPERDRRLVDFDQTRQRVAFGVDHRPAELGAQQPRRLVGADPELHLQLCRGDAVGMGRHEIGGPEPYREAHYKTVID